MYIRNTQRFKNILYLLTCRNTVIYQDNNSDIFFSILLLINKIKIYFVSKCIQLIYRCLLQTTDQYAR